MLAGHLMRVSSMIRADQIAERIGARVNPTKDYKNDVCIYVKPHIKGNEDFNFEGKPYMDIIDGWGLLPLMRKHPEVPVIACSKRDLTTLKDFLPNNLIFIPQHHCNFERVKRTRTGIKTMGVIGTSGAFPFLPKGLKEALKEKNIELIEFSKFFSRQDIIDFYQRIDVQLIWRPYKKRLANPLKMVNASSFGIPTIALYEPYFEEFDDYYFPVKSLEQLLTRLDILVASPSLYQEYSEKLLIKSENYHIDSVAKLYQQLT